MLYLKFKGEEGTNSKEHDREIVEKAIQATPNISAAYIHKKTLKKSQVTEYRQWFQNLGIPVISSKELVAID